MRNGWPDALRRTTMTALTATAVVALAVVGRPAGLAAQEKSPPAASPPFASTFSQDQKSAIERIVKDYLIANPEVFLEVADRARSQDGEGTGRAYEARHRRSTPTRLYRDPDAPIAGNPNGDITVVEFFDYNCGYCKRGSADIAKLDRRATRRCAWCSRSCRSCRRARRRRHASHSPHACRASTGNSTAPCSPTRGRSTRPAPSSSPRRLGLDMAKLKTDMASHGGRRARSRRFEDTGQEDGHQRHAALPRRRSFHPRRAARTSTSSSRSM